MLSTSEMVPLCSIPFKGLATKKSYIVEQINSVFGQGSLITSYKQGLVVSAPSIIRGQIIFSSSNGRLGIILCLCSLKSIFSRTPTILFWRTSAKKYIYNIAKKYDTQHMYLLRYISYINWCILWKILYGFL